MNAAPVPVYWCRDCRLTRVPAPRTRCLGCQHARRDGLTTPTVRGCDRPTQEPTMSTPSTGTPPEVAGIVFEDPPPISGRGGAHALDERADEIATALQANPGRWARVHEAKTGAGTDGIAKRLKARGCETTRRRVSPTSIGLWARHT